MDTKPFKIRSLSRSGEKNRVSLKEKKKKKDKGISLDRQHLSCHATELCLSDTNTNVRNLHVLPGFIVGANFKDEVLGVSWDRLLRDFLHKLGQPMKCVSVALVVACLDIGIYAYFIGSLSLSFFWGKKLPYSRLTPQLTIEQVKPLLAITSSTSCRVAS